MLFSSSMFLLLLPLFFVSHVCVYSIQVLLLVMEMHTSFVVYTFVILGYLVYLLQMQ